MATETLIIQGHWVSKIAQNDNRINNSLIWEDLIDYVCSYEDIIFVFRPYLGISML